MFQIIPAIDLRHGRCVRLEQGDYQRQTLYQVEPVTVARSYEAAGAPILHLVDLDGAKEGSPHNLATIAAICQAVSIPCELGGGIRDAAGVERALAAGAARAILGSALAKSPALAEELVTAFGAERVVAGIDARNGKVAIHGWREQTTFSPEELARRLAEHGLERFIYTDIATDGMFTGPHVAGVTQLCRALPDARFIASGGVGGVEHVQALQIPALPNLEGVIVGKALYDGRVTYAELLRATT